MAQAVLTVIRQLAKWLLKGSYNVYYYLTANKIQVIQVANIDLKFETKMLCTE